MFVNILGQAYVFIYLFVLITPNLLPIQWPM